MTKWDYCWQRLVDGTDYRKLRELGEDSWELVAIGPDSVGFLKRPKEAEEKEQFDASLYIV